MRNDIQSKADYILFRGKIYTVDEHDTKCTTMAVKGNKIIYLGNDDGVFKYIGCCTKTIDLNGKMVLPSFSDAHIHPPGPCLINEIGINLSNPDKEDSINPYRKHIEEYVKENPDVERIYGYGWYYNDFDEKETVDGPRKERLDQLNIDKPIILYSFDLHTVWLNSLAFEEFNIDENTGFIGEGPCKNIIKNTGEDLEKYGPLWGTVKEDAFLFVESPQEDEKVTMKKNIDAFLDFQDEMHSNGITSIAAIEIKYLVGFPHFELYRALLKNNLLKLRIAYSQCLSPHFQNEDNTKKISIKKQVNELMAIREEIGTNPYFKVIAGKFLLDGVVDSKTAYLSFPYTKSEFEDEYHYGINTWENNEKKLKHAVSLLNKNGFQAHFHAIGDEAVTLALDTLEKVNKEVEFNRNIITHIQLLKRKDIDRLKKLHIIAALQVYLDIKKPNYWKEIEYDSLGELAEYEYPLQSLIEAGILVAGASDYPVSEPHPLIAIQTGVTRNYCYGENEEKITSIDDPRFLLNKWERASLKDMIKAYTKNAAYANFMEDKIGTLEVGKCADFIILDKDLYEVDPLKLHEVKVLMTFFDGKCVFPKSVVDSNVICDPE